MDLFRCILVCSISFFVHSAYAKETPFSSYTITAPFVVTQPAFAANILDHPGDEIIVIGLDKQGQQWMGIYGFDRTLSQFQELERFVVGRQFIAFDVGDVMNDGMQNLYFLAKDNIVQYHRGKPLNERVTIAQARSIFLIDTTPVIRHYNFMHDLNKDGFDDAVLPYFEQVNLWLGQDTEHETQRWSSQELPIIPYAEPTRAGMEFYEGRLFYVDMTQDDRIDIVHARNGVLDVYEQRPSGEFSTRALPIEINKRIYEIEWWKVREADGEGLDQSQLAHKRIETLKDVNGDGITDLVVGFTQGTGVFKQSSSFEFYFGQVREGDDTASDAGKRIIYFPDQADTTLTSSKTLSDLKLVDIDGDSNLEVVVYAFDLSITKIIGVLLSGGINQDFLVYKMDDNYQFNNTPLTKKKVRLKFSLSSGRSGFPLAKVADVNNDDRYDLVFSTDTKKMSIVLYDETRKKPYTRALKFPADIPIDASRVLVHDINGDDKDDLIMHYGRLDDAEMLNRITVFLAN